jgi:rSAM/selenodomain-associated transferase 2
MGAKELAVMSMSVIIPTLNAARSLRATLVALGDVDDIVVADGGSTDDTVAVAADFGARIVTASAGRGNQLIVGEQAAHHVWLLFLHADTVLETGWREEVERFVSDPGNAQRAAAFHFALEDDSREARRLEQLVAWRVRRLGLPYGDQGLLIHRDFYRSLGGFRPWPLMEDVDLMRRIGRDRLIVLGSVARTSAERWRRDGWRWRSVKNLGCLTLYFLGVSPRFIARLYS